MTADSASAIGFGLAWGQATGSGSDSGSDSDSGSSSRSGKGLKIGFGAFRRAFIFRLRAAMRSMRARVRAKIMAREGSALRGSPRVGASTRTEYGGEGEALSDGRDIGVLAGVVLGFAVEDGGTGMSGGGEDGDCGPSVWMAVVALLAVLSVRHRPGLTLDDDASRSERLMNGNSSSSSLATRAGSIKPMPGL